MVKYTRRHFEDIAALLKEVPVANGKHKEIKKWCAIFKADNPRFDSKKFAAACGVTNPKTLGKFGDPSLWERKSTPETHTTTWRNKNTGAKVSVEKSRNAGGYPGYAINKEGRGMAGFTITGKKSTVKKDIKEFMKAWRD